MMRGIVGSSLRFPLLMAVLAAVVLAFGFGQIQRMPVDSLPEFAPPYVEVQTEALGLAAEEVEQLITVPLEADLLHGVPWLKRIESKSVVGLSSIVMTFEPGTEITRARQVVAERLTQAHALPNVSKPPTMLQPLSSANRLLMIGMSSDTLSLIDMSVQARWTIRPRLMGVPGVANVSVWGQRDRQLQVQVDPARLRAHDVTLRQVIETTGNALWVSPLTFLDASTPGTGGFIDTPNQRLSIQHILPIRSPEDLGHVPIVPKDEAAGAAATGTPLRLSDVADIVEDHQPLIGDAVVNDDQGLMLVVEKFPGANTVEVTQAVEEALATLAPGLGGVTFDASLYRPASFIAAAMDNVSLAMLVGLLFLAVLLLGALRSWRAAVIGLVTIPLSLTAALFVLYLSGTTLNTMVIAGLVLAATIVANDAIQSTGIVQQRLAEAREMSLPTPRVAVVLAAITEGHSAVFYATLIVALAALPLLFVGGAAGAMLPSLLGPFALALFSALVVGLVMAPPLSLLLGAGKRRASTSALSEQLGRRYDRALGRVVSGMRRAFAIGGLVALVGLLVAGGVFAAHAGGPTIPVSKDLDLLVSWNGAPGTAGPEMTRIVSVVSAELRSTPGVRDVGAHVGRAVLSDRVVGANAGELWISIDPSADHDRTVEAVRTVISGYPGLSHAIGTSSAERMAAALTGPKDDLIVRVYGQQIGVLRPKAEEVRAALAGVDGVVGASVETSPEEPALQIAVDLASAQRYGVKPGDVRRAAATLLSGIEAGSLFEDQKVFGVVVWSIPEVRQNLTTIQDLLIDTPSGQPVRLGDVASVTIAPAPSVIEREGVSRRVDVTASIQGRDLDAVIRDVHSRLAGISFPLEYHAEVLPGRAEQDRAAFLQLLLLMATVIAVGFLLLQAATGSWRLAAGIVVALAAGLAGGALAIPVADGALSIGALVGFLAIIAIGARNGIALIQHYQRLEREVGVPFGVELVQRGARERLASTLVTAAAAALVVLPFLLLGDRAGFEVVRPMALVILGGLATTTFTSLFIVPALYLLSGPSPEPDVASAYHLADRPGVSPA